VIVLAQRLHIPFFRAYEFINGTEEVHMDRVHYRRVTPSGGGHASGYYRKTQHSQQTEAITSGETLIMQCIVSGILLVVVLLVGLVDIAPTMTLRGGIREVLTGANTIGELAADVREFGEEWLGWEIHMQTSAPVADIPIIPLPEVVIPENFAFPALIEEQLYISNPLTAYDEALNPQIPGPSATPGLWD